MTERTMAAKIAGSKPLTVSPGTMAAAIQRTMALTTNVNNPKVRMLIGAVKIRRIGLIKVLITPNTIAARTAVGKSSTPKPGTI